MKVRSYVTKALLGTGILLIGACASLTPTSGQEWTETYAADFEKVKRVSGEAIRELGLGMEGRSALAGDGYVLVAYKERGLQTDQGQRLVRGTSLRVHIERRQEGQKTQVRIEVPSRSGAGGSYGSERGNSQYDARQYAEALLRKLDARL